LRKNKKQRLLVRQNVLKGKNPKSLIAEMEHLDRMEYDPINPAPYNIKVLQEKRKKIKETWDRVYRLYVRKLIENQIFIFIFIDKRSTGISYTNGYIINRI
jgi:WW domain-binding protein 11